MSNKLRRFLLTGAIISGLLTVAGSVFWFAMDNTAAEAMSPGMAHYNNKNYIEAAKPSVKTTAKPTQVVKPSVKTTSKPTQVVKPSVKTTSKPTQVVKPSVKTTAKPTQVVKPSVKTTSKPTQVVKPSVKTTSKPTQVVKPSVKTTSKPTQVVKPSVKMTAKPKKTQVVKPSGKKTAKPRKTQVVKPSGKKTAKPRTTRIVKPSRKVTAKPRATRLVKPSVKMTAKPRKTQVVKPSRKVTAKPRTTRIVKPSRKVTAKPRTTRIVKPSRKVTAKQRATRIVKPFRKVTRKPKKTQTSRKPSRRDAEEPEPPQADSEESNDTGIFAEDDQNAKRAESSCPENQYALTVNATPATSRIRIMNIRPKYRPGICLTPRRYDIYVTHRGYHSYRKWTTLQEAEVSINVALKPNSATRQARCSSAKTLAARSAKRLADNRFISLRRRKPQTKNKVYWKYVCQAVDTLYDKQIGKICPNAVSEPVRIKRQKAFWSKTLNVTVADIHQDVIDRNQGKTWGWIKHKIINACPNRI
jgi:hypothetical protein